ncbi:MAG: hypothetical protein KF753_20045 [Caldilineaceae bacterium]|nr:hypothetical protein [Caldilineaceae bacterium]
MTDPSLLERILQSWGLDGLPSLPQIVDSMDPIAWTLAFLLVGAVLMAVYFSLSTRYSFANLDEVEATPESLLFRLKQDPTSLTPQSIINRLGAEATLELMEFGDRMTTTSWRFQWSAVREELLRLLSRQNAFGPIHALGRYYQSTDTTEQDPLRIRRTVLIHKLGQRRYLEPAADGSPAQLRLHRHPAEQIGELGFDGPTIWLDEGQEIRDADGPLVEMDVVDFATVDNATVRLRIQRAPTAGGGFVLRLEKRRKIWIVVKESIEWTL